MSRSWERFGGGSAPGVFFEEALDALDLSDRATLTRDSWLAPGFSIYSIHSSPDVRSPREPSSRELLAKSPASSLCKSNQHENSIGLERHFVHAKLSITSRRYRS